MYSGICLEEAMKSDGVLCVDVLWASVVWFPGYEKVSLAISSYKDIASQIVGAVLNSEEDVEVHKAGFRTTLDEIVEVVERELEKVVDRYEGDIGGARKEAKDRMKLGFFDGGVSLMSRVAVWDGAVGAWEGWRGSEGGKKSEVWEEDVRKTVRAVREGQLGGEGCGC